MSGDTGWAPPSAVAGVLTTSAALGGLVGAFVGKSPGAARGALAAPSIVHALGSLLAWGATLLFGLFALLVVTEPKGSGSWVPMSFEPPFVASLLFLGGVGCLASLATAGGVPVGLFERTRGRGRFALRIAAGLWLVQHLGLIGAIGLFAERAGRAYFLVLAGADGAVAIGLIAGLLVLTSGPGPKGAGHHTSGSGG
jgi:hypothetical protein